MLHGERYIEVVQAVLASATAGSTLHVRAYSFDGRDMSRPSNSRSRTEPESDCWQTTRSATALSNSGRPLRGWKAKGLQCGLPTGHQSSPPTRRTTVMSVWALDCVGFTTRSPYCWRPRGPELVAGSLNFTTSSKANSELGVRFSLPAGSNAAATWLTAFEAVWAESTSVEDAAERAPRGQRSKPTSSSNPQQNPAVGS